MVDIFPKAEFKIHNTSHMFAHLYFLLSSVLPGFNPTKTIGIIIPQKSSTYRTEQLGVLLKHKVKEKNLETQMIEIYNQAMEELKRGDVIYAGKKFSEAELLYPQSIWAPRAVLMSAYGFFSQGYYKNYNTNITEKVLINYLEFQYLRNFYF